jgi:hypothetical protein
LDQRGLLVRLLARRWLLVLVTPRLERLELVLEFLGLRPSFDSLPWV